MAIGTTLHLNLIGKWFDKIKSGEKPEEYRGITDYWARRLISIDHEMESAVWVEFIEDLADPNRRHKDWRECMDFFGATFRDFEQIHFKNGFARNGQPAPCFDIAIKGLRIGPGDLAWGAEHGKEYFVLELGEIRPQAAREG